MEIAQIISIVSVCISVISTSIAAFAISNTRFLKQKDVTMQNYEDVRDWFEHTLLCMKELYIRFPKLTTKEHLKDALIRFGTQIDIGRLYFPNQLDGDYKIYRPEVFRGRRVLILDILVLYYNIYNEDLYEENQDLLWSLQRAYISETVLFLEKNIAAARYVPYTYIDRNHVLHTSNLKNEKFREMLMSSDIVKAIKDNNEDLLTEFKTKKKRSKS